jgi:hypothetical protein
MSKFRMSKFRPVVEANGLSQFSRAHTWKYGKSRLDYGNLIASEGYWSILHNVVWCAGCFGAGKRISS